MRHVIYYDYDQHPILVTCTCGFETKADSRVMAEDRTMAHLDAAFRRDAMAAAADHDYRYTRVH